MAAKFVRRDYIRPPRHVSDLFSFARYGPVDRACAHRVRVCGPPVYACHMAEERGKSFLVNRTRAALSARYKAKFKLFKYAKCSRGQKDVAFATRRERY